MELLTTVASARRLRAEERASGLTVALVPTMGALHEGHLSLVRRAAELAPAVWVSIFVNPAQFSPGEDLERYPRDLERDLRLLGVVPTAVVFAPSVAEMYPHPAVVQVLFSGLERELCGASRPGHFAGVGLVVAKLFNVVQPEVAVFGQKDAQQALLVRRLAADLDFPVQVEVAPTVREADGLAMSSRNAYLSADQRRAAPVLNRALLAGRALIAAGERRRAAVEAVMREAVAAEPLLELEYAECRCRDDLTAPALLTGPVLLAIAARAGRTRLIDNEPVDL